MVTLEELAPLWAPKIKSGKLNPTKQLNLADPDKCFVSEAHGFKRKYYIRGGDDYCSSCTNFGQSICDAASGSRTFFDRKYTKTPKFMKKVTLFLSHWNRKHDILERKDESTS